MLMLTIESSITQILTNEILLYLRGMDRSIKVGEEVATAQRRCRDV